MKSKAFSGDCREFGTVQKTNPSAGQVLEHKFKKTVVSTSILSAESSMWYTAWQCPSTEGSIQ